VSRPIAYGIDFGTSNSSIAVGFDDGADIGVVSDQGGTVMPSIVYIDATRNELAGDDAVDNYIRFAADPSRARLMSSLKTFLTDRGLTHTDSDWGQRHTIPELVAIILRQLKRANDKRFGADVKRVVLGHPVLFAGASGPHFEELQEHAMMQLDAAARIAGFEEVAFLDEPTAALMGEDLDNGIIMAVDFGGGTFDVSIIALTPDSGDVLAIHGAAIGGELFDSLLFDAKVASELQLDREYVINGKRIHVPSALRRMRTLHEIIAMVGDDTVRRAFDYVGQAGGDPLGTVEEIIYGGHAYNFFRAIEGAKIELSSATKATIAFRRPRISVSIPVARVEFETLLHRNLDRVDDQIERALKEANIDSGDVDLVVRTGGSSRIPAFVERLEGRFGARKLAERDAFSTVAVGLGIRACELWG
jgi:hypothetical chaperone protein